MKCLSLVFTAVTCGPLKTKQYVVPPDFYSQDANARVEVNCRPGYM